MVKNNKSLLFCLNAGFENFDLSVVQDTALICVQLRLCNSTKTVQLVKKTKVVPCSKRVI